AAAQEGAGWVAARHGLAGKDLNAVYFSDSKRGWVGGDEGLLLRTQDGGRSWVRQRLGTREGVSDLYFRDKEDGYLLAGNQIFLTEDGGQTWRLAARFLPPTFAGATPDLYSVRFTSKKRGWVVGSLSRGDSVVDSLVLQTTDGGASWNRQRVPVRDELIHLDFDGDKRGWIVGTQGRVLHTRDGGETWTLQRSGTAATLYHVDFRGDDRGWAVGERGTILRTVDGGETWAAAKSPARTTLLSVKFVSDDEGWAVGRGGVILRTEDGGQTWMQQESKTRQHLYALFFDKKTGWAVGGDGLVFRYDR
ncbi:MAG TPA: YCF48-related protein, partial [Pyrinomonadaceae bacterium]|nr:YCF48-related protein [Pyrinomonadaceae bacterium]